VYSTTASELIRAKAVEDNTAKKLELLMDMTNETVGDAISDMLLVESILHARGWSIQDWNKSYQVGSYTNPH
jgi:phosphoacetylglucosamine mutase